jgi:hypothetical protein
MQCALDSKAAVENGVLIAERRVLGALRDGKFFSLAELNAAITQIVADINTEPFQKREGSRHSVFEAEERPATQALPLRRYEYAEWKIGARVHQDHHIEVGRAYYSVHYTLIGQRVDARLSAHTVEIFLRGANIATHPRATRRYQRLTIEAHRPPEHRAYLALGIDGLLARAERVGPLSSRSNSAFTVTARCMISSSAPTRVPTRRPTHGSECIRTCAAPITSNSPPPKENHHVDRTVDATSQETQTVRHVRRSRTTVE